jgi:hypothetical protein
MYMKNSLKKWRARNAATQRRRRVTNQGANLYTVVMKRKIFEEWRRMNRVQKLFCNKVGRYMRRIDGLSQAWAFHQWVHINRSAKERTKERKKHGGVDLSNVLHRLHNHKITDVLLSLKNRSLKKANNED